MEVQASSQPAVSPIKIVDSSDKLRLPTHGEVSRSAILTYGRPQKLALEERVVGRQFPFAA